MATAPCDARPVVREEATAFELRVTDLDRHAARSGADHAVVVAELDGRVCGRASYVRVYGPRAALLVEVDDAYWHHGLAGALLIALAVRAARFGITTFLVRVSANDIRLLALLRERFCAHGERDGAHVALEFALRDAPA